MTEQTPIEVFAEATKRGLKLSFEPPFTLVVNPRNRCRSNFVDTLSQHKPQLLALLELPFLMVYLEALEETVFFAEDGATKAALVEAGADEWSIYTKDELRALVAQNRATPFLPGELCTLHEGKRTFRGRIAR
jgi:hypothetical protein